MFSLFSDSSAPNLHPVSSRYQPEELFSPLNETDLEWTCAGGFATETQTFYQILNDGRFLMCQVIHSSTGLWYPTVQFTFKLYNPATKEVTWRSSSVSNFVTPPPGQDKRSCKSDTFSIVYRPSSSDPDHSENYTVTAKVSDDISVSLIVTRPNHAPSVKIGSLPKGGYTYFGTNMDNADGYVVHRFWPQTKVSGHITFGSAGGAAGSAGRIEQFTGFGMLVHAIQGMRPNLIARRWNFCWFTGHIPDSDKRVSAIMMEFTTTESHGRKKGGEGGVVVNVGCVSVGERVAATAETKWPDAPRIQNAPVISRATHLETVLDKDTGYMQPQKIEFSWQNVIAQDKEHKFKADLLLDVGFGEHSKGLIEKVDVLAEIPKVLKTIVHATGTKPYIYQWMQPNAVLHLHGPEGFFHRDKEIDVEGTAYVEASYVS